MGFLTQLYNLHFSVLLVLPMLVGREENFSTYNEAPVLHVENITKNWENVPIYENKLRSISHGGKGLGSEFFYICIFIITLIKIKIMINIFWILDSLILNIPFNWISRILIFFFILLIYIYIFLNLKINFFIKIFKFIFIYY